jgi:hypothetical protein
MQRNSSATAVSRDGLTARQSANHPAREQLHPAFGEDGEIEIAGRRYVRQQRLATILGVTERTLARWNARGIGPPKITIGKTVLFDLAKVPDWLAARETPPTRNARR